MNREEWHRGEVVLVTVFGGDKVERRVWEPLDERWGGAAVCTEERYWDAIESGIEPLIVGFKRGIIEHIIVKKRNRRPPAKRRP